ncbi:MAG: AAA family ATPase [Clostridioides difficile]|nr:AAA family ATPase [Clostridioides difficile]
MAKVISFINMKGGVGKTTLTINIGKQIAEQGKKVLIIDMDPQFNATQSLLYYRTKQSNSKSNTEDLVEQEIIQEIRSSEDYKMLSNNHRTVLQIFESTEMCEKKELIQTIDTNLFLIPGDLNLYEKIAGDTSRKVLTVNNYLEDNNILKDYEFILIDCPPTWSILTFSSLVASDYYIIPSKVDFYSSIGISLLEDQIDVNIRHDQQKGRLRGNLKRLGIVFTLVHKNIVAEETRIMSLKNDFKGVNFFNNTYPHMPSVPTKITLIDEVKDNKLYSDLANSLEKITNELLSMMSEEEKNEQEH